MIAVVDYGAGNLRSVCNALDLLGRSYRTAGAPQGLEGCAGILLPGVGHFGAMMESLEASGLGAALRAEASRGTPLFGICLGMQALFEGSEEAPGVPGLALIPGQIERFRSAARIPHMGWNDVQITTGATRAFYFANSYFAPIVPQATVGVCEYGEVFSAIVRLRNVEGVQFHPEKSGDAGIALLAGWCGRC